MSVALDAEAEKSVIRPIWFLFMDVEDDPLYAHTGQGSITFAEDETGDPALDGHTFEGLGVFAMMGDIQQSENGSGPMQLTLPGVDPDKPGFKPLIADRRRWQYRRAIVWFSFINEEMTGLIDYPQREKTGRLDNLQVTHDTDTCTISIDIEGFAANSAPPLASRYADQPDIDPDDISMSWVADLANRQPELGPGSTQTASTASRSATVRNRGIIQRF
jgi:hypothetical protein